MSKQLLIYESAVPVSTTRHAGASVETNDSYAFCAGINAVPLMAIEFPRAAAEYAIVFTAQGDDLMPAAVLGVRNEQNLYLSADLRWKADYIPAFIRRYPFVFASSADGKSLTLCIDESHPGFNREGRGSALFGDDAEPTPYVTKVLEFLQEYQAHFERTRVFGRHIKELGLLEPMQATVTTPKGETLSLGGFMVVSRDKLRALDGETLQQMARNDELELLYLHLASLRNFNEVKDRLLGTLAEQPAAEGAV
ncbi:MAG TPA: SapC family protein [Accumulibacter sp.]|uniref:SapC family protein n=1 Tax=Accumulibacter sp. TaxID=2053492 RepID=UPI002B79AC58|nr:SapC family protein [Accumulibacter sp.]HRD90432.1 SapC family protein [Accumulibacter sp.]